MNQIYILFFFVPLLSMIFLILNLLLSPHKPDEIKNSTYECGFTPVIGQTRTKFPIHFYIVAMLFLIFDLELLLLYPLCLTLYDINLYGFFIALLFFLILTIGFVLEISSGAISIDKSSLLISKRNKERSNLIEVSRNPLLKIQFIQSSVNNINIINRRFYSVNNYIYKNILLLYSKRIKNLFIICYIKCIWILSIINESIVKILNIIYKAFSINPSPFKFKTLKGILSYFFILSSGLLGSFAMRLNYYYSFLEFLPPELDISIRILSALFSVFSIFIFIIMSVNTVRFYKNVLSNPMDRNITIIYTIYYIYILLVNLILFILNYDSMFLMDIDITPMLYIILYLYGIIYGLIYGIVIKTKINLNKTLTKLGQICLFTFVISWIFLFCALRFGIISEILKKYSLFTIVYNETTSSDYNKYMQTIKSNSNPSQSSSSTVNNTIDIENTNPNINIANENKMETNKSNQSIKNIYENISNAIVNSIKENISVIPEAARLRRAFGDSLFLNHKILNYYKSNEFNNELVANYNCTSNSLDIKFLEKYDFDVLTQEDLIKLLNLDLNQKFPRTKNIIQIVNYKDYELRKYDSFLYFLKKTKSINSLKLEELNEFIEENISNTEYADRFKLSCEETKYKRQHFKSFIPLFRKLNPGLEYLSLENLLSDNDLYKMIYDYFDINISDKSLNFRNILIIDPTLSKLNEISYPGYWSADNFERLKGITSLTEPKRILFRESNFTHEHWDDIRPLNQLEKKFNSNQYLYSFEAIDENGWMWDRRCSSLQYLTNSGNIISLKFKKEFPARWIDRSVVGSNMAYLKIFMNRDNLIPTDDSSNIVLLYKLLKNRLKLDLFDFHRYEFESVANANYFSIYLKTKLLTMHGFHSKAEFSELISGMERAILENLLPKSSDSLGSGILFGMKTPIVGPNYVNIILPADESNRFVRKVLNIPLEDFKLKRKNFAFKYEAEVINLENGLSYLENLTTSEKEWLKDRMRAHAKDYRFRNELRQKIKEFQLSLLKPSNN
jgi:NADH-ubiquinone oxidoreductase chain 3